MKSPLVILLTLCTAVTAGAVYYLNQIPEPNRIPAVDPVPAATTGTPEAAALPPMQPLPPVTVAGAEIPATAPVAASVAASEPVHPAVNHIAQAVDTLLSPHTSFAEKHALWRRLHDSGELDQVVAELKQRAAASPASAEFPAALGEAYLNKFPVTDYNEGAILGMQADQSFDAALKIDPANWEAQYFKAAAMSYWPVSMNKGPEVIQRLSNLIDQQESASSQTPDFAQTYALLGDQYLKAGQPEYAQQTWKLGASRFPNDVSLQLKLGGQSR